jgi:hypothetical protein
MCLEKSFEKKGFEEATRLVFENRGIAEHPEVEPENQLGSTRHRKPPTPLGPP